MQGNIISGIVTKVYADNTLLVAYEISTITGETDNPLVPENPKELEVRATINRTFVSSTTPMYKMIDPSAVYALGDRVALYEMWEKLPGVALTYSFYVIGLWRVFDPPTGGFTVNV